MFVSFSQLSLILVNFSLVEASHAGQKKKANCLTSGRWAKLKKNLTSQNPRNPEKLKVAQKWLKSDFRGLGQSNPESNPENDFLFWKITNFTRNFFREKSLSFQEILRAQIPSKITKSNSQGIIFRNNFVSEGIFRKGMRTATFQFSESVCSLNGPELFTELPFLHQTPHSLNPSPVFSENLFFHWRVFRHIPFPKIGSCIFPGAETPTKVTHKHCFWNSSNFKCDLSQFWV